MSVELIQPTDTLSAGFRSKYNNTAREVIVGYEWLTPGAGATFQPGDRLRLKKFGGGFIDIDLSTYYVTKEDLSESLIDLVGIPYMGSWAGQSYNSTVLVDYNGVFYRSNAATTETDEPGVSPLWVPVTRNKIPSWVSGVSYDTDDTVRYTISGVQYVFISNVNDNLQTPALSGTNWQVVGNTGGSSGLLRIQINPGDEEVTFVDGYKLTIDYSSRISNAIGAGKPNIHEIAVLQPKFNVSDPDVWNMITNANYVLTGGEITSIIFEGAMSQDQYDSGQWFVTLGN